MIIWARIETEPNYIVFQLHQRSSIIDTVPVSECHFAEPSNPPIERPPEQVTYVVKEVFEDIPEKHRPKTHELPQM